MKWNINVIYRIIYTCLTIICIGGLVCHAFLAEEETQMLRKSILQNEVSLMEQLCWLVLGVLAAGCIFVLFYLCNGNRLLKLLIAMVVVGYIGYCFWQRQELANTIIIIAVIMILQSLLEYLVKDAIYTLPLFLVFGCLLTVCPVKEGPLQWTVVKQIYAAIETFVNDISAKLDYYAEEEDSMAAFSETPSFGGSVEDNEIEQLTLVGDRKETGMYLIGRVYNIYTEDGWKNEIAPEDYNENGWNYVQLLTFLKSADVEDEWIKSLCTRRTYKVEYQTIYTETAFTFLHTVFYDAGADAYEYRNGSAVFDKPKDNGFQYDITYIDINYGNDMLQEMWKQLNAEDTTMYSYEELRQYSKEHFYIDLANVISEEEYNDLVKERENIIFKNYLKVPNHVPERVRLLAKEITKDCGSDYEKVSAIAEYLHSFDYSSNPMDIEGDCIIDAFLFESQEGYCTHFASAMVLLSRSVGIPARYVSGFYLGEADKSESDTYHANGNDAHAWAECYIEGYGFLPVEATAGYYSSTMQQWSQNEMDSEVVKHVLEEQEEVNAEETEQKREAGNRTILVAAGGVAVIVLVLFLIGLFCFVICYRTYQSLAVTKQCRLLWYMQMQLLTKADMGIEQGETLREYDKRLQIKEISDVIALYEKLQYGQMNCATEDKMIFHAGLEHCKRLIKGGNIWLFWYFLGGMRYYFHDLT